MKIQKWKLIEKVDVSPSRYFPISMHTVELENGKIINDYFVGDLADVVMILPILKTGEMVLVQQYKHGIEEILIELPAGMIEKGKNPQEMAVIELREEIGVEIQQESLVSLGIICDSPTKLSNRINLFIAQDLSFNSQQQFDENENIEIVKMMPKDALKMVMNGEIWVASSCYAILKASYLYPHLFR